MADTSKSRTRRRSTASSKTAGTGRSGPKAAAGKSPKAGKPKPKAKSASAAGVKTRRPSSAANGSRTGARRSGGAGRGKGRAAAARPVPGLSLRTLVFGSVALALVVVGAALGVSLDDMLRGGEESAPPAAVAAAPARPAAPPPAPAPTPAPRPAAVVKEPTPERARPVSPPAVLRASEAQDYAQARAEYKEVPPSTPPILGATPAPDAPQPRVKPPVPEAEQTQVAAAVPVVPPKALRASPRAYEGDAPWLRNAVAAPAVNGRPMIAVVIDDLGVDKRRSALTVKLPGPLTMAWMTYADDVAAQAKTARAAGHELIIHMPMEPLNSAIDSGPDVLRTTMTADQVRARVRAGLRKFEGYVGVNNHMGSKFTADPAGMAVVIDELRANGLLFLDSKTSPRSVGGELAAQAGMPHAIRDVFIDNVDEKGAVLKQLAQAERIARKTGYAIAIGHPHDGTIQALKQWLPTLEDKGLVLVPLSAIVRKRMGLG